MILATRHGNRELRSAEFGSSAIPPPGSGWASAAGVSVTSEAVYGLPAVSAVLRSIADLVASLSMIVYRDLPDGRERAVDSWQYRLLHDEPAVGMSAFQFYWDIALSIEAAGNAFIRKLRSPRGVEELYVLDPQRVSCTRERDGEVRYRWWRATGDVVELTGADVLHIRGFTTTPSALCGQSLIQLHRDPLGSAIAVQKFEGAYFRRGARPGVVLEFPGTVSRAQAKEWIDAWNAEHEGLENAHKTAAVGAGGKVVSLPVSLEDALFVETKRLAVEDVARIFRWPRDLLELADDSNATDEQRSIRLLKLYLLPRLRRIERALAADRELFGGSALFPEFLTESLLRADMRTRNESYLKARQAGWMTANEIRERENMPSHPDGDQLQTTPVGGAPNPEAEGHDDEEMGEEPMMMRRRRIASREPEIHYHMPEGSVELRQPDVIVNIPEQPAPVVNVDVHVPEQAPAEVHVAVPPTELPTPEVTVNVEPAPVTVEHYGAQGWRRVKVERDRQGRIKGVAVDDEE